MNAFLLTTFFFAVALGQSNRCKEMEDILIAASKNLELELAKASQKIAGVCSQTGGQYDWCIRTMQDDMTLLGNAIQWVEQFKETQCEKQDFSREELEEAKKAPCSGIAHYLFQEQLCGEVLIVFRRALAKITAVKDKNVQDSEGFCWNARFRDTCIKDLMDGPNRAYDILKNALVSISAINCEIEAHVVCKEMANIGRKFLALAGY